VRTLNQPGRTRPEPTEAEREAARKADRITGDELMKRLTLSADELTSAIETKLLPTRVAMRPKTSGPFPKYGYIYSKSQVIECLSRNAPIMRKLLSAKF
jgi:hypothetical protein